MTWHWLWTKIWHWLYANERRPDIDSELRSSDDDWYVSQHILLHRDGGGCHDDDDDNDDDGECLICRRIWIRLNDIWSSNDWAALQRSWQAGKRSMNNVGKMSKYQNIHELRKRLSTWQRPFHVVTLYLNYNAAQVLFLELFFIWLSAC